MICVSRNNSPGEKLDRRGVNNPTVVHTITHFDSPPNRSRNQGSVPLTGIKRSMAVRPDGQSLQGAGPNRVRPNTHVLGLQDGGAELSSYLNPIAPIKKP